LLLAGVLELNNIQTSIIFLATFGLGAAFGNEVLACVAMLIAGIK